MHRVKYAVHTETGEAVAIKVRRLKQGPSAPATGRLSVPCSHLSNHHNPHRQVLEKERIQQQNMGHQIKKEIAIMKLVCHRYVVRLKEVLASKTKVFIVLELVTGGELFDKLVTEGR